MKQYGHIRQPFKSLCHRICLRNRCASDYPSFSLFNYPLSYCLSCFNIACNIIWIFYGLLPKNKRTELILPAVPMNLHSPLQQVFSDEGWEATLTKRGRCLRWGSNAMKNKSRENSRKNNGGRNEARNKIHSDSQSHKEELSVDVITIHTNANILVT